LHWPDSADEIRACRALVANLDFTSSIGRTKDGHLDFPVFAIIGKIARLHAETPVVERWCLLLTLNAAVEWPDVDWEAVLDFVRANLSEVSDFREAGVRLLGDSTVEAIEARAYDELPRDNIELARLILQAFVPKKIADIGRSQGWRTETRKNLSYPGAGLSAGLVSWIIRFRWDPRAMTDPQGVYRESVSTVLQHVESLA
jgi:hypothetical protein